MSAPPGMFEKGSSVPSYTELLQIRPDGSNNYVETMVEQKLKEVKLEDRPRLYREFKDEYGLESFKFYDGIDEDQYKSFVRKVIETLGSHGEFGKDGKYKLSTIIQELDKSGSRYEEEYTKFKKHFKVIEEKRESIIKKKKMIEKLNNDAKTVKESKWNIDVSKIITENANSSSNITSSSLDNSYNHSHNQSHNNTNVKKTTQNINDNSMRENHITIKIDNINLIIDGDKLNNLYKQDDKYTLQTFLSQFEKMDKKDQVGLIEQLQKIISYSPNLKEYEIHTDYGTIEDKNNNSLNFLPRMSENNGVNSLVLDNKCKFIEAKSLNDVKLTFPEKMNLREALLSIGATSIGGIYDIHQNGEYKSDKFTEDDYIRFDNLIEKYGDICKYQYEGDEKDKRPAINLGLFYESIANNVDDTKILTDIVKQTMHPKINLTNAITQLIKSTKSKYYVGTNSSGDRLTAKAKLPIIFIRE